MDIGTWVAALLTLAIYSFLYKDNPFYRFAEHLLVGVSVGFLIVIAYNDTVVPKIIYPLFTRRDWWIIIPILLGVLMFARFFPKFGWMSRPAMALYIGFGAGVAIPSVMQSVILAQIKASISPFANISSIGQALNAVLILLGSICVLLYFYFSKKHEGAMGVGAKLGIYFLMIFFGATFGFTVMARISLLIGRAGFLLRDWLHLIKIG
ncbi:MAG: hypothetical protein GX409_05280 [candidate division Zixibacteria bacterium]|nr:hypothetical protein [candidate division Zixibacteria bacterium]